MENCDLGGYGIPPGKAACPASVDQLVEVMRFGNIDIQFLSLALRMVRTTRRSPRLSAKEGSELRLFVSRVICGIELVGARRPVDGLWRPICVFISLVPVYFCAGGCMGAGLGYDDTCITEQAMHVNLFALPPLESSLPESRRAARAGPVHARRRGAAGGARARRPAARGDRPRRRLTPRNTPPATELYALACNSSVFRSVVGHAVRRLLGR